MSITLTLDSSPSFVMSPYAGDRMRRAALALVARGCAWRANVSDNPDFVIVGKESSAPLRIQALARGIPLCHVEQAEALAQLGTITLAPAPVVEAQPFDESIAELRGLFDGLPSDAKWEACLNALEGSDEHAPQHAHLLAYIARGLERWDTLPMTAWQPDRKSPWVKKLPRQWHEGNPEGELRVAPPAWIFELLRGEAHEKHRIVRAINLDFLKVNTTLLCRLLASEHLPHLTHLNTGAKNTYTAKLFIHLKKSPLRHTLTHLTLRSTPPGMLAQAIHDTKSGALELPALEQVHVVTNAESAERWQHLLDHSPGFATARQRTVEVFDYMTSRG